MTRVSQLWDFIDTWGFREDIKDAKGIGLMMMSERWNTWAVLVCSGQYWYALGSTGMLWAVPVWFWDWYALSSTGMLWAVPVLPRVYRYCSDHTGTAQNVLVLPRAYWFQKQTGTAQSIPVLPRTYRYCPGVLSSRFMMMRRRRTIVFIWINFQMNNFNPMVRLQRLEVLCMGILKKWGRTRLRGNAL